MTEPVRIGDLYLNSLTGAPLQPASRKGVAQQQRDGAIKFDELLQQQMVRFSRHAEIRLKQRGIQLEAEQLAKLNQAIDKAAAKGAKDSLILLNEMALIVNIPKRTVVTAMDESQITDNVFTQIDSAVIMRS